MKDGVGMNWHGLGYEQIMVLKEALQNDSGRYQTINPEDQTMRLRSNIRMNMLITISKFLREHNKNIGGFFEDYDPKIVKEELEFLEKEIQGFSDQKLFEPENTSSETAPVVSWNENEELSTNRLSDGPEERAEASGTN